MKKKRLQKQAVKRGSKGYIIRSISLTDSSNLTQGLFEATDSRRQCSFSGQPIGRNQRREEMPPNHHQRVGRRSSSPADGGNWNSQLQSGPLLGGLQGLEYGGVPQGMLSKRSADSKKKSISNPHLLVSRLLKMTQKFIDTWAKKS